MITYSTADTAPQPGQETQFFTQSKRSAKKHGVPGHGHERRAQVRNFDAMGWFAMSIVHDIRNPLAAICAGTEMLSEPDLTSANVKRLAGNIHVAALRMRELVSDLMAIVNGDPSAGRLCDLREVIVGALEAALAANTPRGVRTLFDVPDRIMMSLARSPVERVFFNVIGNAIEAMPHGGTIRIRTQENADYVSIAVEDTGLGIPAAVRHHLFEPFVTWGKPEGLGLGLALARQILRSQGGDMWFEPAANTRFMIRLPISHSERPERQ